MQLIFDTNGNDKQKQVAKYWIDDVTTDIAYGGSKGSGKSYLGVQLIFGDAFLYPSTYYFIARKTLTNIRKFTIPSIHEVFGHWGITDKHWKYNGQDSYFELYNGSRVYLIDAKYLPADPQYYRFGSMQMTRGWIEEAGEFEEEAKNNLAASVGRWKNDEYNLKAKLLQTCNPSKNYLYREYYLKNKEKSLPEFRKFVQALPEDNKKLAKGYLENLHNTLSNNEKERLLYGNWEFDDNPNALNDYTDIVSLFTNDHIQPGPKKYLTCDIAYQGSDLFVIGYWEGWVLKEITAIDKCDETRIGITINDIRLKHGVPIGSVVYDADGLKMFVRQSAKDGHLQHALEFHNGAKPVQVEGQNENFKNLKTQCYFLLAKKIKSKEIYIGCPDYRKQICEELEQICKLPLNDEGKIELEPKSNIRERLGRSPDFADMIMMRIYFEIHTTKIKYKSYTG